MVKLSDAAARARKRAREKARAKASASGPKNPLSFNAWLKKYTPRYQWDTPHSLFLQAALDEMTAGRTTRLLNELPIRHGKSELATIRYAVYRLWLNPSLRILILCHTAGLAEKFGRRARSLARSCGIPIDETRTAVADWHTQAGGNVRSVGVGGTVIGEGYDLILGDDLLSGRAEAESQTQREKVWDFFAGDLYGRLEPGGQIVLTMSRWHQDDPIGRCLEGRTGDSWIRVRLPAVAEEGDPLGRAVGDALWPERWGLAWLLKRRSANPYEFESQYQQNPTPREGRLFKVDRIQVVDRVPPGLTKCLSGDLAATEDDGDWTALVAMSGPDADGLYYIEPWRCQKEPSERNRLILQKTQLHKPRYVTLPKDPAAAGKEVSQSHVRMLAGFNISLIPRRSGETKILVAEPLAAQVNAGNIRVVKGPEDEYFKGHIARSFAADFIEEYRNFPMGANDDWVDSGADAFNKLSGGNGQQNPWDWS